MPETQGIVISALTDEGHQKTVQEPLPGSEKYFYVPNLCDPCTWYGTGSIQVLSQSLTDSGDLTTWTSPDSNIIDLRGGRVFKEADLVASNPDYALLVEVSTDGGSTWTAKAEGTDFTASHESGSVTFTSALSGSDQVRAHYYKANNMEFVLAPDPGKRLKITYGEAQFTKDINMTSPVYFEVWAYNPNDLPNKMMIKREVYHRIVDFFQESTGPFPVIPAFGGATRGLQNDMITIPFSYLAFRDIKASQGAEIRIKLDPGVNFTGEFANATFYCLSEDE